jgi:hypothetical protein
VSPAAEQAVACFCPGNHETDTVTLKETLGFRELATARMVIRWAREADSTAGVPEVMGALLEFYLRHTIASWSCVDEKGKPLPVTPANVDRLLIENPAAADQALEIGELANDRYSIGIVGPLVREASRSSRPSPITRSTSRTKGSSTPIPRPSKRSSISTIPTADTAKTA